MIALIDSDLVAYRCSASCEPTKIKSEREPLEVALLRAEDLMTRILAETNATSYRAFLGGSENFRMQIDPNYKANRKDMPKPMWLQDVRAYLVTEWKAEITDGIEADDALGIKQTKYEAFPHAPNREWERTVICSIDKDLHMIPGLHYNFVKQEWREIDSDYAIKWFYQQLIQGDQTDNIMGYDGKARPKIPQFLQPKIDELWECETEREMFNLVRSMYAVHDVEEANSLGRLINNANLLWIQRYEGDKWHVPES